MSAPLVAIPSYCLGRRRVQRWGNRAFAVPEPYVAAIRRSGMRPVILTAPEPDPADQVLEPFHALLLLGGEDVDRAHYGGADHPEQQRADPGRDALEIDLIRTAAQRGLPTLAICRGIQVMNVAFGGTLLQHLPEIPGLGPHGVPGGGQAAMHDVKVSAGSVLARACGKDVLTCSSHHHQGIDRVGDGLTPVGWSEDGLVEALEREDTWMIGVQWHPEDTAHEDPAQQSLFDSLADRAREFALSGRPD
jgi:putative glutamine amidotransferase